jgi:hypothetical protein
MKAYLAATTICFSISAFSSNIVIDSFTDPQELRIISYDPAGTTAVGRTAGLGILGMERETVLTKTSGIEANISSIAAVESGNPVYSYGYFLILGGLHVTHTCSILWDGSGDLSPLGVNDFGLINVDFVDQNAGATLANTYFHLPAIVDIADATFATITIYRDSSNYSQYFIRPVQGGFNPPFDDPNPAYSIPLSAFANVGTGADFDNVKAIEILFESPKPGAEIALNAISVAFSPVPEAKALWGLLGFSALFIIATASPRILRLYNYHKERYPKHFS